MLELKHGCGKTAQSILDHSLGPDKGENKEELGISSSPLSSALFSPKNHVPTPASRELLLQAGWESALLSFQGGGLVGSEGREEQGDPYVFWRREMLGKQCETWNRRIVMSVFCHTQAIPLKLVAFYVYQTEQIRGFPQVCSSKVEQPWERYSGSGTPWEGCSGEFFSLRMFVIWEDLFKRRISVN